MNTFYGFVSVCYGQIFKKCTENFVWRCNAAALLKVKGPFGTSLVVQSGFRQKILDQQETMIHLHVNSIIKPIEFQVRSQPAITFGTVVASRAPTAAKCVKKIYNSEVQQPSISPNPKDFFKRWVSHKQGIGFRNLRAQSSRILVLSSVIVPFWIHFTSFFVNYLIKNSFFNPIWGPKCRESDLYFWQQYIFTRALGTKEFDYLV